VSVVRDEFLEIAGATPASNRASLQEHADQWSPVPHFLGIRRTLDIPNKESSEGQKKLWAIEYPKRCLTGVKDG